MAQSSVRKSAIGGVCAVPIRPAVAQIEMLAKRDQNLQLLSRLMGGAFATDAALLWS